MGQSPLSAKGLLSSRMKLQEGAGSWAVLNLGHVTINVTINVTWRTCSKSPQFRFLWWLRNKISQIHRSHVGGGIVQHLIKSKFLQLCFGVHNWTVGIKAFSNRRKGTNVWNMQAFRITKPNTTQWGKCWAGATSLQKGRTMERVILRI